MNSKILGEVVLAYSEVLSWQPSKRMRKIMKSFSL